MRYAEGMERLPGADLIAEGLRDLATGEVSAPALLVSIGAPRLRALGIEVTDALHRPEHRLYAMLYREHGDGAHSKYNALIRRLVSYERSRASAP